METSDVKVQLKSCRGLKEFGGLGKQNPYCILSCLTQKFRSCTNDGGGKDPVWNQTYEFQRLAPDQTLKLEIFDETALFWDKQIGTAKVPLQKAFDLGAMDVRVPVFTKKGKEHGEAFLHLTVKNWKPKAKAPPTKAVPIAATRENQAGNKAEPKTFQLRAVASGHRPSQAILPTYFKTDCWAEYKRGRLLGEGSFGKTYLATHIASGDEFAVKVISKRKLNTAEAIQDVRSEVEILHHLQGHPHVVRLENVYEDLDNVCIVMELMSGGQLLDRISERERFTEKDAAALTRDIVSVIAKCHAETVIHRDIKPENFLFTDNTPDSKLKAADFGLSSFFKEGQMLTDVVGSAWYMAPELLQRNYGKEADIWSCGVILYILLSGRPPFGGNGNEDQIVRAIKTEELDLESDPWDKISEPAKDCIRKMLRRDPKRRAKAQEILNMDWLKENGCASDTPIEVGVVLRMKKFNQGNKLKRAATQMIVSNLPLDEIKGLKEIFTSIDRRRTGRITLKEFADALKLQGTKLPESELREMWQAIDVDGDGTILYEEFLTATIHQSKLEREDRLKAAFMKFDQDQDGFIDLDELRLGLSAEGINDAGIEDIINQVDENKDGLIDYAEFCAMMRGL